MSSADKLCNQFGPRQNVSPDFDANCLDSHQARHDVGSDLDQNCLIL